MMRYWMTTLLVGIGTMTACQLEGNAPEMQASQALGDEVCDDTIEPKLWNKKSPEVADNQLAIVYEPVNGNSLAVVVDHQERKVTWSAFVPSGSRASFVEGLIGEQIIIPGFPPGPGCVTQAKCHVFYAVRTAQVEELVEQDLASCDQ